MRYVNKLAAVELLAALLLSPAQPCSADPAPEGVKMFSGSGAAAFAEPAGQHVLNGKNEAARVNQEAVELVLQGRHEEGLVKLRQAEALDPDNASIMYNLAGVYLSRGSSAEAVVLMEKLIRREPKDISFLQRLAEAYTAAGRPELAVKTYEQLLAEEPGCHEALVKLGALYGSTGDWNKAEQTLRRAVETTDNDAQLLTSLGSVLIARGKHKEAVEVLKSAQAKFRDSKTSLALGMAYESLGNIGLALASYREAQHYGEKGDDLERHIAELENLQPAARFEAAVSPAAGR